MRTSTASASTPPTDRSPELSTLISTDSAWMPSTDRSPELLRRISIRSARRAGALAFPLLDSSMESICLAVSV